MFVSSAAHAAPGSPAASPPPDAAVEWEYTTCLLCGGADATPVLCAPDPTRADQTLTFQVVRCQACGLCYTNPRPDRTSIGQFYPDGYAPHRRRPPAARHRRPRAHGWGWPRKERDGVPWVGQGRLLDFGCGGGSYLERMHRQGWQVLGLDVSATAVERVRTGLGLPALVGSLPHPELKPGSFDVITMWHSLEHLHDPVSVLREARKLLAAGGKLLVAVPNFDSLPVRWFGTSWFGLELPRHLTHFTPGTLRRMLEHGGFRVERVRMVRHSDWMRSSARLACRRPAPTSWQRLLRLRPVARLATWYSFLRGQSDCILAIAS